MEVFHQFRENLKALKADVSRENSQAGRETSEYCSEVSEDYNSADGSTSEARRGILKRARSLPPEEFLLPQKLVEQLRQQEQGGGRRRDSGFHSEQNSSYVVSEGNSGTACDVPSNVFNSELGSNYLQHYGLDGPIPEYVPPPVSEYGPEAPEDPPSVQLPSRDETSIGTRKKRATEKKNATIRQHYYPEGGWGWVVLACALLANLLGHGLQLGYGVTLLAVKRRWGAGHGRAAEFLGALSICTSLFLSPLTIATCRRKSTRLTAVVGGLITALGCLFTSFASQFHQIFFSYGIITGVGVGFVRDTSTLMAAQYFKRRREAVEVVVVSASGLGLTVMSHLLRQAVRDVGWRIGLQCITGLLFTLFILGMFYRSATLYHPQRRAILHLKSQKRKIKDKNKAIEEHPPFFDFSSLKSRTFQIILASSFISSFGMFTPVLLLLQQSEAERVVGGATSIQTGLGLAWVCGVLTFGLVIVRNSVECRIGRQYLCQTAGLTCGVSVLVFTSVQPGEAGANTGYTVFVWVFGIFAGGYQYALKMFVFEKVRARNFARAWGFLQMSQSVPVCLGVPLSGYIDASYGPRTGYYFSGATILAGSLVMFLINAHKSQLRAAKRKRRADRASIRSASTNTSGVESSVGSPRHEGEERRNSFAEEEDEEDLLPALALINQQQALLELIERHSEDGQLDGIPDLQHLPEHLLLEELEMLDNITSCNVVDNYLMLDEYEQNLIKEGEGGGPGGGAVASGLRSRLRKWSLVRQPSQGPDGRGTGIRLPFLPQQVAGVGRRAITTIGEDAEENAEGGAAGGREDV